MYDIGLIPTTVNISQKPQMASRYMKKFSASLIIREMQIKTIVRCHLPADRMVIIRKTKDDKCW
jgi:hypothetical protein